MVHATRTSTVCAYLVVKTGTTLPEVSERRGDFEDWFAAGLGVDRRELQVVEVFRGASLPAPDGSNAIVVTGSAAMVSEHAPWSDQTGQWLAAAAHAGRPLLAVCYGHQLLAWGLGGDVAANPRGREIGTVEVRLREEARTDPLFAALPPVLRMQASHQEAVMRLPEGVVHLAESDRDPHQAFRFGERAWSVQFHPEFDANVIRGYIAGRRSALTEEGLDPDALYRAAADADDGQQLLRRFAELVRSG
jgi:GMP synthase (glutamine-hydrolysing)